MTFGIRSLLNYASRMLNRSITSRMLFSTWFPSRKGKLFGGRGALPRDAPTPFSTTHYSKQRIEAHGSVAHQAVRFNRWEKALHFLFSCVPNDRSEGLRESH